METSLDDLFREAVSAARLARALKPIKAAATAPDQSGLYRNPDNWRAGAVVALLHEETQTLLGRFQEYLHKTVPDARRLVREANLGPATRTETVVGWQLSGFLQAPTPRRHWHKNVETVADLSFSEMFAEAAPILACFGEGQLERVELIEDTAFQQSEALTFLPAGTNILPHINPARLAALLLHLGSP